MPARRRKGAVSAPAWGITLAEFRGSYRAIRASSWYLLFAMKRVRTPAEHRHAAVVAAACLCLPLAWHKAHEGRLSDAYYRQRAAWLNVWRPISRKPIDGIHPEAK